MRMIGDHENAVAGHRRSPVRVAAGDALGGRPLVLPERTARPRVEREALVRRRHVHDPARHHRGRLQQARIRDREEPARGETRDAGLVDLRQRGVPVPAGLAVVDRPIRSRGDGTEPIALAPQQMHPFVRGPELQIGSPFAEQLSLQRAAVGGPEGAAHDGRNLLLDGPQEFLEAGHLRCGQDVPRHPAQQAPVVDELREVGLGDRGQPQDDGRAHLAAPSVGAVAARAALLERLASGLQALRGRVPAGEQERWKQEDRGESLRHALESTVPSPQEGDR